MQHAGDPKVSIIVPVYNVEPYLAQCLDALLVQTLHDIEVIALDDGSTDGSLAILESYAARDARLRVISKPNEGYGITMNRGIDEARAAYVGFVESDDWPEPDMFEKLYRLAQSRDCDLVKCDFFDTFEDHETLRRNLAGLPFGRVFDTVDVPKIMLITPSTWAALYRRSFLDDNDIRHRTTPGAAFQDCAFSLKCLFAARRCALLRQPLLHYRRDNPRASMKSADKLFTAAEEFEEARTYFQRAEERRARFAPWERLNEWRNYRWEYERIAEEGHAEFLGRVRAEMLAARGADELDWSVFTTSERIRVETLMDAGVARFMDLYPASFANPALLHDIPAAEADVKVSVVIPAYNDEGYLSRAVRSCLAQSHANVEVVCVDDCSADDTLHVARALATGDARVKVVAQSRNSGEHNARLAGVQQATGDLLLFLDADDELSRNACRQAVHAYRCEPYDILHFAAHIRSDGRAPSDRVCAMTTWLKPSQDVLMGRDIVDSCFVRHEHSHNVWGKAYPTSLVKGAFAQLGEWRADSGVDALEYFAIACNSLVYRSDPTTRAYVYHLGDGLSSLANMGAAEFHRSLQGFRAIEGMRRYLESQGMMEELQGAYDAHRMGQTAFVLQTWLNDVRHDAKEECLRAMLQTWDHDLVIDEACKLGSDALNYVRAIEGESLHLSEGQTWACGYADGMRDARRQMQESLPYKVGCAAALVPRKIQAFRSR